MFFNLIEIEFTKKTEYVTIFWSGNIDEDRMLMKVSIDSEEFEALEYHSGMVMTKDKNTVYACTDENIYSVTKYVRNNEQKKWEKITELPRSPTDDTEVVLQLKLDKYEKMLFGT